MMSIEMPLFSLVLPEISLVIMACLTLLLSVFYKRHAQTLAFLLAQTAVVIAFVLTLHVLPEQRAFVSFGGSVIRDHFSIVLQLFLYTISFVAFIYMRPEVKRLSLPPGETYTLLLFSLLGMVVMVSAHDLINTYLGIELLSLPLYALIAMHRKDHVAPEAAIKYFIMGAMASGFLLYGLSLIYGLSGSLVFSHLAHAWAQHPIMMQPVFLVAIVFIIAGLAFKLGLAPFHMWVPDVYQGAPSAITAFLSSAPKVAAFALLVRLLFEGFISYYSDWAHCLLLIALVSIFVGNMMAIAQDNIKRLLAYSAVAHMGYVLLGVFAATPAGLSAAMFYAVVYAITALGAFGVFVWLDSTGQSMQSLSDFRGLNQRNPCLAFMFLLLLFSMAGVPPTAGFMAKFGVISALVAVHQMPVAAFALVMAIVGAFYYLRVVRMMYFESGETEALIPSPGDVSVTLSINALAVMFFGIFPGVLLTLCHSSFF
jgi:NADH-quinone oxidoreductase subunit N